jgi:hypothetical protein
VTDRLEPVVQESTDGPYQPPLAQTDESLIPKASEADVHAGPSDPAGIYWIP